MNHRVLIRPIGYTDSLGDLAIRLNVDRDDVLIQIGNDVPALVIKESQTYLTHDALFLGQGEEIFIQCIAAFPKERRLGDRADANNGATDFTPERHRLHISRVIEKFIALFRALGKTGRRQEEGFRRDDF